MLIQRHATCRFDKCARGHRKLGMARFNGSGSCFWNGLPVCHCLWLALSKLQSGSAQHAFKRLNQLFDACAHIGDEIICTYFVRKTWVDCTAIVWRLYQSRGRDTHRYWLYCGMLLLILPLSWGSGLLFSVCSTQKKTTMGRPVPTCTSMRSSLLLLELTLE